jgi:hypothetical protein
MATGQDDGMGALVQALFAERDGLKRFLEAVVNAAMQGEPAEHVGAAAYSLRLSVHPGFDVLRLSLRLGGFA